MKVSKHIKYTTVAVCVLSLMLVMIPAMAAPAGTPAKDNGGKIEPFTYKPGEVMVGVTNTVVATPTVEPGTWAVGVNTITNKVYVANGLRNWVSVIDGRDY